MTDDTKPDAREARLPKWAQAELASLRRSLADARRERDAARLATDPANSSALLDPYEDIPVGLGKNARVRFVVGDDDGRDWLDVHVVKDWSTGGRAVEVLGGASVSVRPQSGNVVVVALAQSPRHPRHNGEGAPMERVL